jgi:serine phosphatase RsbU (regulator of sigma subunit)/ABC-type amino acid transport substrate-binding protein
MAIFCKIFAYPASVWLKKRMKLFQNIYSGSGFLPVISVVFFLCLIFSLPDILLANQTLHVGFTDNKPTVFVDHSGKPQGIYIDVLTHIAGIEGWDLEYHADVWKENLRKLQTGEIDLLLDIAYTGERAKIMNFSQVTLVEDWARLFIAPDSEIEDFPDITGKKIGLVKADIHTDVFLTVIKFLGVKPVLVMTASYAESMDLLAQGRIEGMILPNLRGRELVGVVDCVKSDILFNPVELRFAAPFGKNQDILDRIDVHVAALKANPSSLYHKSMTKWVEGVHRVILPQWLSPFWLGTGVISLIVLIVVFNISLRYQVKIKTEELQESIVVQQKQESELVVARDIQMGLLPASSFSFGEYELTAFIEPARMVGGDFFDFFRISDDWLCFLIADVADKGIPAALFMAATKTCLTVMARDFHSVAGLMESVNREISENNPRCMFVTMFCGVIDCKANTLHYTLAGHEPPFLLRENGELLKLDQAHCMALGLDEDAVYEQAEVSLFAGDLLFMFTDGVSEAMNSRGEQFGESAVQTALLNGTGVTSDTAVSAVRDAVQQFVGTTPPHDDITMLCIRRRV